MNADAMEHYLIILRKFAAHMKGCKGEKDRADCRDINKGVCTCGLAQLLQQIREAL